MSKNMDVVSSTNTHHFKPIYTKVGVAMKRFILFFASLALCVPLIAKQEEPPITRESIEALIDSPEFAQLTKEIMPDMPDIKMTKEEREQVINDTLNFAHKMESLPPEEQERELRGMMEQLQQPLPPEIKEPRKTAPVPVKTEDKEDKKTKISTAKAEHVKRTLERLAKRIEKVELRMASLLQVSPDRATEQHWARAKQDLPWLVSALHRISNNEETLKAIGSHEYTMLTEQIDSLYRELKRHSKHLKVPDTAKLRKLEDKDLARAGTISEPEKRRSKQAATQIIHILDSSLQNVTFGLRKMLEKYAADMLAQIEKEAKTKKDTSKTPSWSGSSNRSSYPSNSYRDSSGGYGSYYPSSGRSSGGYSPSSRSSHSGGYHGGSAGSNHGSDSTGRGAAGAGARPSAYSSDQEDKDDGVNPAGTTKDSKSPKKEKQKDPRIIAIENADKKAKDVLDKTNEGKLDVTVTDEKNPATRPAQFAIQNLNLALNDLQGTINSYITSIEKFPGDIQEKHKAKLLKSFKDQKSLSKVEGIARVQIAGAKKKDAPLVTRLQDFLTAYDKIIKTLKPAEKDEKKSDE